MYTYSEFNDFRPANDSGYIVATRLLLMSLKISENIFFQRIYEQND